MPSTPGFRRLFGITLIVVAIVVAVVGFRILGNKADRAPKGSGPELPSSAGSFVLITIDTTRADHLEPYGAEDVETPSLQALADSGVTFEQAYAVAPITLVSHTSMLTGLYPPHHGVRNNGIHHVADDVTTIAEILDDEGFETAAFISAAVLEDRYGLNQGFDVYDDDLSEGGNRSGRLVPDRPAGQTVDSVVEWLDQLDTDSRFFAWVHFYDPHAAYSPPPPFRDRYREDPYSGEIAYMDSEIGRLLQHPRLADQAHTGVIVVGDHGESLGEHGEETHAILAYDSTLHVPFLLRLPDGPAGLRVTVPVDGADVAPTILESLDVRVPDNLDGVSAHDTLSDYDAAMERSLYAETYLPYYTYGWSKLKVLRKGFLKMIDGPGPELFDTRRDPRELTNVLERMPNEAHDLEQGLRHMEEEWGDAEHEASMALDSEAAEQLRALGYLAVGSEPVSTDGDRPNPRDVVGLHVGLERARRFSSSGLFEQAVETLNGVLEKDPGNLAALVELASAHQALGQLDEAQRIVEQALARDPGYTRLYIILAAIEDERGDLEKALALLDQALDSDPRNIEASQRKAHLLHRLGRHQQVKETLDRALELNPNHPGLDVVYAHLVELAAGQEDAATARLTEALDRDPYLPRGWRLLGQVHERRDELDEAMETYRKGLERQPDAAELHGALGLLLARTGNSKQAVPHLREAIRLAEVFRPEYHVSLGAIAAEAGRFAEATQHYDLVLENAPNNRAARNNRAIALYRLGRMDEAIAELDSILAEHPNFGDATNNRAAVAIDQGQWDIAEKWATKTLELNPEAFEAWNNLGVAQDELGRHTEARTSFERALELAPTYRPAQVNLGISLKNLGENELAAKAFEAALKASPADPLVHLELGDLYFGPLGDRTRARQHYNAYLKAAPGHPRAGEIRQRITLMAP